LIWNSEHLILPTLFQNHGGFSSSFSKFAAHGIYIPLV
jgi:hypothetical protein